MAERHVLRFGVVAQGCDGVVLRDRHALLPHGASTVELSRRVPFYDGAMTHLDSGRAPGRLSAVARGIPLFVFPRRCPQGLDRRGQSVGPHAGPPSLLRAASEIPRARFSRRRPDETRLDDRRACPCSGPPERAPQIAVRLDVKELLVISGTLTGKQLRELMENCAGSRCGVEGHSGVRRLAGRRLLVSDSRRRYQRPAAPRAGATEQRRDRHAAGRPDGAGHRRRRQHRLGNLPAGATISPQAAGAGRAGGEQPVSHRAGDSPLENRSRVVPLHRRHHRRPADGPDSSPSIGPTWCFMRRPTSTCR